MKYTYVAGHAGIKGNEEADRRELFQFNFAYSTSAGGSNIVGQNLYGALLTFTSPNLK